MCVLEAESQIVAGISEGFRTQHVYLSLLIPLRCMDFVYSSIGEIVNIRGAWLFDKAIARTLLSLDYPKSDS